MIDDEMEVAKLLRDMEDQLPIPARPTVQLSEKISDACGIQ
jgi:hypothetical protein